MELWIRSQDREILTLAQHLDMYDASIVDEEERYVIEESGTDLGTYETRERALEVLDEIQDLIKPRIITTNYQCEIQENPIDKTSFNLDMKPQKTEIQEFSTYVYEMPKE